MSANDPHTQHETPPHDGRRTLVPARRRSARMGLASALLCAFAVAVALVAGYAISDGADPTAERSGAALADVNAVQAAGANGASGTSEAGDGSNAGDGSSTTASAAAERSPNGEGNAGQQAPSNQVALNGLPGGSPLWDEGAAQTPESAFGNAIVNGADTEPAPAAQNGINSEDAAHDTKYEGGAVLVEFAQGANPQEALAQLAGDTGIQGLSIQETTGSYVKIGLPRTVSVEEAAQAFNQSPSVDAAQPNFRYYLMDDGADDAAFSLAVGELRADWTAHLGVQGFTVNDPYANVNGDKFDQWALKSIQAYDAWSVARAEKSVGVAVIDNCFNITHEDLKNNVVATYNADADAVGPNSGVKGETYKASDTNHGTHVAGIVAAEANNGIGVAGVSYNARLMLVRAADDEGGFDSAALVRAYDFICKNASANNVRVINVSLGAPYGTLDANNAYTASTGWESSARDDALLQAIDKAWDQGIVTVTSSGNAGTYKFGDTGATVDAPFSCWPGDYDKCVNVIALAKPTSNGQLLRTGSSNYNMTVNGKVQTTKDISAPGGSIYSTSRPANNDYATKTGTSMASPCVAGVMALMFAADPSLSAGDAVSKLYSTATDLGDEGFDASFGYGEVNAYRAVEDAAFYVSGATAVGTGSTNSLEIAARVSGYAGETDGTWNWTSSNPNIAAVKADGAAACTVTGVSPGTATIRAELKADNGTTHYAQTTVSVFDPAIAGDTTIEYGQTAQLSLGQSNPTATWTWASGDTSVATVGARTGLVSAKHPGTTTITVSLNDNPHICGTVELTVTKADLANAAAYASYLHTVFLFGTFGGITASRTTTAQLAADGNYYFDGQQYTGNPIEFTATRLAAGTLGRLEPGTDYDVAYANNTDCGMASVTFAATDASELVTGTKTVYFNIGEKNVSNCTYSLNGETFTYTGSEQVPSALTLTYTDSDTKAQTKLVEGRDYLVTYSDNVNAGTAKASIMMRGEYIGSGEVHYTISPVKLTDTKSIAVTPTTSATYAYTGSPITRDYKLAFNGKALKEGADYTITYANNTNAGTATASIVGKGNFTGTLTQTFAIKAASVAGSDTTIGLPSSSYTYTGSAITPVTTVKYNGKTLTANTDYTVAYANNVNAGTATVTVTGKGNFTGTKSTTFTIEPFALSGATMTLSAYAYWYDGSSHTPTATVTANGTTLSAGTNYTLTYSNNTDAGTATVTAAARGGNYTGSIARQFAIQPLNMAYAAISLPYSSYPYTGTAVSPKPTVTMLGTELVPGTDYALSYSNNVNAGAASVTITGKGNYTGARTGAYTISKAELSSAKLNKYSYTYNGTARKPTAQVYSGSTLLRAGTDYTVSYSNNKKVGFATAVVQGKGNYAGSISFLFSISSAKNTLAVSAKTATVKYANVKKAKRTVARASVLTVKKAVGTVSYTKVGGSKYLTIAKKTGKVTVKKGTPRGTYKIKVRVTAAGNANYNSGSKTVTAKVRVKA